MKKIFHFSKKQKGSPSASETASVLSAGYVLKEKDLGKVHKAAYTGDVTKLKQLSKKNDLNQLDKENRTALHIACVHGHTEVVHYLVESKVKLNLCDNQNRSALMKAVQCQQDRCVSILLEHEADPNLVDINGNTALHLAASIPSLPVALQLLEHEANINAQNKEGNSPLILSVKENHTEMAEFLLKEGADINTVNQEQRSPLMIAACNGHINMVRLLLQYNADTTVKDKNGWSSDDCAVMNGHHACSHLIVEHGTKWKPLQSPSHLTPGKKKHTSVLDNQKAGFALAGPALDKDAARGSAKGAGKDTEDSSLAESISRASKSGLADSWPSTDDDYDELDMSPKKPQKVNLKKLISSSKREGQSFVGQDPDKSWSGTESDSFKEGCAIEQMAFPARSVPIPHPIIPTPSSFPNLPQMTSTPLINSQKKRENESSSEDDYEEDDEEDQGDEVENAGSKESKEAEHPKKEQPSQDKQRDFLSELGFEKEDEDSPWDSESGSDSPRKQEKHGVNSPIKSQKAMPSICEENSEALLYIPSFLRGSKHSSVFRIVGQPGGQKAVETSKDENGEEETGNQPKSHHMEPVSVLNKMMASKEAETKRDFIEELGLGDVEDLEDASDWDSASTASRASKTSRTMPVLSHLEELAGETLASLPVIPEPELHTSNADAQGPASTGAKEEQKEESCTVASAPLPSPRAFKPRPAHTLTSTQPQPKPQPRIPKDRRNSDEESDWDIDSTSSPAKMITPLPNIAETQAVMTQAEGGRSVRSLKPNEQPDEDGGEKSDAKRAETKNTALWNTLGSVKHAESDQEKVKKADTNTGKPIVQQEGLCDSGPHQKGNGLNTVDRVSPGWQARSPRSNNRRTAEDDDAPPPKQSRTPCLVNHRNGDPLSVFDDGSLSEMSDDGRRSQSRDQAEKLPVQSAEDLEMADDFEDLTQSSDTATDEMDSAALGYGHASLLLKQLDTCTIDSVSMVKLQNMFHEYERTIQKERSRHGRLFDKVSQLEQERNELKLLLEKSRDSKNSLEHLRLELETDLNNLKFVLKQEQEKHHGSSMLYERTREQLRRKEEQHQTEAEERQKAELKIRSLELEIRALMNSMKQLEEDRSETQRVLAHERSARALQEDLLNSHLRKQQDLEEKNLRNLNKSTELLTQLPEATEHEKELQHLVSSLQEELSSLRAELEHSRSQGQEEESRHMDERDALKERLEDAKRDLKLNEETLAQTVFQCNGQVGTLKSEYALLNSKLEHERQLRQQLEAEAEASRTRLQAALQETERCQVACADAERALQRERDQYRRAEEKWTSESCSQRDSIQSLSQKLTEGEARLNSLENELHRATLSMAEKSALLEMGTREREQNRTRLEELEGALQSERERASRAIARQDALQERLAQAQSESVLLRQQLEESQNRGTVKEQAVTDAQERFTHALNQLRADGEERVQLVEERNKELVTKNTELREQNYKLEQDKAERENSVRQLQQELADALKKLAMCEASLEVNTRYRSDLEEEKRRAQKDMDRLRGKLQESEDQYLNAERRINALKGTLDEKERDLISTSQKLQEVQAAAASTEQTIKQLEEAVQRLEIENARLEATAKQQNNRIEILQKEVQESTALSDSSAGGGVRNQLEDLVTNLQSSKMNLEDQLSREVQKQKTLVHNAQDSQVLWEDELKSRSRVSLRLAELEKEKGELSNQMELQKKKAKRIAEQKKAVDARLEREMQRNAELQKEMYRLRTLVKTAKKKLWEKDGDELDSSRGGQRGELSFRQTETEEAVSKMKVKVNELQVQLEREASRCSMLEEVNRQLKEQLSSLKSLGRSHDRLERSKQQLEDEVMGLRRRLETGVMDYTQAEQFRRNTEERARQEIRDKLDEVNLFLQTQAASQEALEQIKAANEARQRTDLEQRIKELENELSRARSIQQDNLLQTDSSRTELERYRQLYNDELRLRKSIASKLERANERLAEANTKLLSERQRSTSLLSSSIMNGSLGGPALDRHTSVGAYGASLGPLNSRLSLGASLLGSVREPQTNQMEEFLAKMQTELEKNISKELDKATTELEVSARMSPVGSVGGSQRNLNMNLIVEQQDPVSRATQQYLEVLKKNYMI